MWWKSLLIVLAALVLFFTSFIINKRVKTPDCSDVELPEHCLNCKVENCQVKKQIKKEDGENNERS